MNNNRKLVPGVVLLAAFVLLGIQIYTMPNRAQKHLEREGYTNVAVQSLLLKLTERQHCFDRGVPMAFSATKGNQRFEGHICGRTYFLIFETYYSTNTTPVSLKK